MTFWICRSCRHSFPSDLLEQASFTDHVGKRFGEMRDTLSALLDEKENPKHRIHEALISLEGLCAAVHEEVGMLTEKLQKAEMRYSYDGKKGNEYPKTDREGQKNVTKHSKKTADSTKGLPLAGPARGQLGNSGRGHANAAALTSMMASSSIPEYNRRKMCTAFELVSASVYSILESLAVHTRVDAAFLWIRPRGAITNELVAPFVVGRDLSKLSHSAPYRLTENSIPCVVADTGIAINIKPMSGVRDQRPNGSIPLVELIEQTNAAQLLTPVFTRYWTKERSVLGVVHLIGTPRYPFPFHRRNEEVAAVTARLLSVVLSSHYEAMVAEWANHFYDPGLLHKTSAYRGDLDLQGDTKGVDDFAAPALLIYREAREAGEEASSRDASKALRLAMLRRAVPLHPIAHVRDVHRHTARAEQNADDNDDNTVAGIASRLESITQSQREADASKAREKEKGSTLSTPPPRGRDQSEDLRSQTQPLGMTPDNPTELRAPLTDGLDTLSPKSQVFEGRDEDGKSKPFSTSRSKNRQVLKPEELTEIELVALQRLKSMDVDTAPLTSTLF